MARLTIEPKSQLTDLPMLLWLRHRSRWTTHRFFQHGDQLANINGFGQHTIPRWPQSSAAP